MDTHFVSTKHLQGMAFQADVNGHTVNMDSSDTGIQSGASPKRLMLASLAGCTGIDVVSILEKMKVTFSEFSIDIDATLSEAHPRIYEKVKIIYRIRLSESDQPKMEKAVHLSQEKYCGVSAMFRAFCKIESEIIFG
jgi:putative redox protein